MQILCESPSPSPSSPARAGSVARKSQLFSGVRVLNLKTAAARPLEVWVVVAAPAREGSAVGGRGKPGIPGGGNAGVSPGRTSSASKWLGLKASPEAVVKAACEGRWGWLLIQNPFHIRSWLQRLMVK